MSKGCWKISLSLQLKEGSQRVAPRTLQCTKHVAATGVPGPAKPPLQHLVASPTTPLRCLATSDPIGEPAPSEPERMVARRRPVRNSRYLPQQPPSSVPSSIHRLSKTLPPLGPKQQTPPHKLDTSPATAPRHRSDDPPPGKGLMPSDGCPPLHLPTSRPPLGTSPAPTPR
ncbi:hypothetical protein ACLOJK_034172 [Asimina triloba]